MASNKCSHGLLYTGSSKDDVCPVCGTVEECKEEEQVSSQTFDSWKELGGGFSMMVHESKAGFDAWMEEHRGRAPAPQERKDQCDVWGIVHLGRARF